jgi:hypothetical protein
MQGAGAQLPGTPNTGGGGSEGDVRVTAVCVYL